MKPAIDHSLPTTRPRRRWRKIILVAGIAVAVPGIFFGGFIAWFQYEMTRNEIVIMVDNKANASVDAMLFETGAPSPAAALNAVAARQRADQNQNTWRSITPATFRVRVGTQYYEGDAGYLLDDDGPHRFWVKAFDDHVIVTRQSNESPSDLKMQSVRSASH